MPKLAATMTIKGLSTHINGLIKALSWHSLDSSLNALQNDCLLKSLKSALSHLVNTIPDEPVTAQNIQPILDVFTKQDALIADLDYDYTMQTNQSYTSLLLAIAELFEDLCGVSRYKLIMPSLESTVSDITTTDLKDPTLRVHHFIRCRNRFLEVLSCLESAEQDGILKHTTLFNNKVEPLSIEPPPDADPAPVDNKIHPNSEAGLIIYHSKESEDYYNACVERNQAQVSGSNFGATLMRFAHSFRMGNITSGELRRQRQGRIQDHQHHQPALLEPIVGNFKPSGEVLGTEYDAGTASLMSVFEFSDWFRALDESQQITILRCKTRIEDRTVTMLEIWNRLTRNVWKNKVTLDGEDIEEQKKVWNRLDFSSDADRSSVGNMDQTFCVNTIAHNIECIVTANRWLYSLGYQENKEANEQLIAHLANQVQIKKNIFIEALADPQYQVRSSRGRDRSAAIFLERYAATIKTPKEVIHVIKKLNVENGTVFFSKLNIALQAEIGLETIKQCHDYFLRDKLAKVLGAKIALSFSNAEEVVTFLNDLPGTIVETTLRHLESRFVPLFKHNSELLFKLIGIAKSKNVDILDLNSILSCLHELIDTMESYQAFLRIADFYIIGKIVAVMVPHLPSLVKKPEHLFTAYNSIKAIGSLNSAKKHTDFLKNSIQNIKINDITSTQFAEFLKQNNGEENTVLFDLLGSEVVNKIDNEIRLTLLFLRIPQSRHVELIQFLTPNLLALINIKNIPLFLSHTNQVELIKKIGSGFANFFANFSELASAINSFNSDALTVLLSLIKPTVQELIRHTNASELLYDLQFISSPNVLQITNEFLDEFASVIKNSQQMIKLYQWVDNKSAFWHKLQPRLPELITTATALSFVITNLPPENPPLEFLKGLEDKFPQIITRSRHFVEVAQVSPRAYQQLLLTKYKSHLISFCCPTHVSAHKRLFSMLGALHVDNHRMLLDELMNQDVLAASVPDFTNKIRLLKNVKDTTLQWSIIRYFLKNSPELSDTKTIDDYNNLLEVCPKEHHQEFINATQNTLLKLTKTHEDFNELQALLSDDVFLGLCHVITSQKLASLYRPNLVLPKPQPVEVVKAKAPSSPSFFAQILPFRNKEKNREAVTEPTLPTKEKGRVSLAP